MANRRGTHPNSLANLKRTAGPGRPKHDVDVRVVARKYTMQAFRALREALTSRHPSVRVRAAEAILDRAYGRPVQAISGPDGETWVPFTLMLGEGVALLAPEAPPALLGGRQPAPDALNGDERDAPRADPGPHGRPDGWTTASTNGHGPDPTDPAA